MNPASLNPQPNGPGCELILYRALRRRTWFNPEDPTKVKSEAFMRRRPKETPDGVDLMDEDGLSVFDAAQIGLDECIRENRRCFGVATLHVGTMRDMGLSVIWDPADSRKGNNRLDSSGGAALC